VVLSKTVPVESTARTVAVEPLSVTRSVWKTCEADVGLVVLQALPPVDDQPRANATTG
jgi:hypothetical protein